MWLIDGKKAVEKAECYGWDTVPIYNAPTINAIPISWIKEWIAEIKDHPMYTEKERMLVMGELEDMLCGWEYEQEELMNREAKDTNGFNEETAKVIADCENGIGIRKYSNVGELFADLEDKNDDIYFEAVKTLAKCIGSITYGKERWFYEGDGLWYDREKNKSLLVAELIDEIIDAVKEESER